MSRSTATDANSKSLGGNDAQLTNILSQCIYQWAVLTDVQAEVARLASERDNRFAALKGVDFSTVARGCEGQLDHTDAIINSDEFSRKLDSVIEASKKKLAPE